MQKYRAVLLLRNLGAGFWVIQMSHSSAPQGWRGPNEMSKLRPTHLLRGDQITVPQQAFTKSCCHPDQNFMLYSKVTVAMVFLFTGDPAQERWRGKTVVDRSKVSEDFKQTREGDKNQSTALWSPLLLSQNGLHRESLDVTGQQCSQLCTLALNLFLILM